MSTERERIVEAIEGITADLKKGRIPYTERLCMNADRHDLRKRLAEIEAVTPSAQPRTEEPV